MKITGIVPDEWIVSYASGALSEAHALVIASHCHFHPDLQKKVKTAEDIGGLLMEDSEPSSLSNDLFDDLMKKIDTLPANDFQPQNYPILTNSSFESEDNNERIYMMTDWTRLKWRLMGPGLSQVRLWTGPNDERLWLLKAKGGTKVPLHDHNGLEMTLVLHGSYHVGQDCYSPGMLEIADDDTVDHMPVIDQGDECICLVLFLRHVNKLEF